jgi:hypothetical protein
VYSDCIVCPSIYNFWLPLWCIQTIVCLTIYNFWLPLWCIQTVLSVLQLLVTPLVYSDCIVSPTIYNFWLPLCCIQTVLSVLRFTTSDYPFCAFRLYCLSFDLQLLITPLVYSDCIVCPSIYNFWLPLWCIQTVLSVLRFTTSDYSFVVFRLYCLSFDLQLLVTPLVCSDCIVCP